MNIQPLHSTFTLPSGMTYAPSQAQRSNPADTVHLSKKVVLSDEEALHVLGDVEQAVAQQQEDALSAHSGLSHDRVMSLLEGL